MDNRRQYYRHRLLPGLQLPAEIAWHGRAQRIAAVVVNLSVEGVSVQLDDSAITLRQGEQCSISLAIPGEPGQLEIPCVAVYENRSREKPVYGLNFLPVADPDVAERREKVIWRFLLDEQRKQRREEREKNH